MRDYEDPIHIPPLALKIFTLGLITLFIITPLIVAIRIGYIGNIFSNISLGLAAIGLIIGCMFIQRLILWFIFTFYWYIAACIGFVLLMMSLAFMAGVATMPDFPITNSDSPLVNIGIVGSIILGLGALYLIFRAGGVNQSTEVQSSVPNTPAALTPQKKILDTAQQIASRKKNLGLDDKDKVN